MLLNAKRLLAASNRLAETKYSHFLTKAYRGRWRPAPHNLLLCEKLEKVERGEIKRLIVNMPPRHGKSMTATQAFPAWYLGRNQTKRVMEVSYSNIFARKFGTSNRNILAEFGPQVFYTGLSRDRRAALNFELSNNIGGMISAGLNGAMTGEGADVLFIDDPIKSRADALSAAKRENMWTTYTGTILQRVQAGGAIVLIMTRWHEDDLAGRILSKDYEGNPDDWEVLNMPAICESEDDPLGRSIGDALWPQGGYDIQELANKKQEIGSYEFDAQYQGRPRPDGGTMFEQEWLLRYKELPNDFDQVWQSWDLGFDGDPGDDFVVGQVWGKKGAAYYLIDQERGRWDFIRTIRAIERMTNKYPQATKKIIEKAANGSAAISVLRRDIHGIVPRSPKGSKISRASAVTPLFEAGNVYIPENGSAPWVGDYVEELLAFPLGKNDDQVDATTQALYEFTKRNKVQAGIRIM